jgi:DNA-binding MarR family transcriptional regulator
MPRSPDVSRVKFGLAEPVVYNSPFLKGLTMSQAAILLYLANRELIGGGPAGRQQILSDTQMSERTVDGALAKLKRDGRLVRFA